MRKLLLIRLFILNLIGFTAVSLIGQNADQLFHSKIMQSDQRVKNELYQSALIWTDVISSDQGLFVELEKQKAELISKLYINYPELRSELRYFNTSLKKDQKVSPLIKEIIKRESVNGTLPKGTNVIQYAKSLGINSKDIQSLNFYYGYELFQEKKYKEAIKVLADCIQAKGEEYNYAQYYTGMGYLLLGDYQSSQSSLLKIGKDKSLENYLPYYLAATHYALGNYQDVVKYYAPRNKESKLFNLNDLNKIVAYSYYNEQNYASAALYLAKVQKMDQAQDILMLSICYNRQGQYPSTLKLLSEYSVKDHSIDPFIQFEKAIALGQSSQEDEAIFIFNNLAASNQIDQNLLRWNITLLYARKKDYDSAISQAQTLLNTQYKRQASDLITQNLDRIDNPTQIAEISRSLSSSAGSKEMINDNIYYRTLDALKRENWTEFDQYLKLLEETNPHSKEYKEIIVHKGLNDMSKKNIISAKNYLSIFERLNDVAIDQTLSSKGYYNLAYLYFQEENGPKALGYFTKSLDILKSIEDTRENKLLKEDIYNRLGDIYLVKNDLNQAKKVYKTALGLNGNQGDYALFKMALIAELNGEYYDQIILLTDLSNDYPNSALKYKAEFLTANSLFELGKYEEAEKHYRLIVKEGKDNHLAEQSIIQLGLINVNAGNFAQAEQYYQRIIQGSKNSELQNRAREALKEIYADHSVNTDAYIALSSQESTSGSPDEIIFKLAQDNFYENQYSIAINQLNKLINEYPKSQLVEESLLLMAKCYSSSEDYPKEAEQYIKILENNPNTTNGKDIASRLSDILFKKLKEYQLYIQYSDFEWFTINNVQENEYRYIYSSIELNRLDQAQSNLLKTASSDISSIQREELYLKLMQLHLDRKNWKDVILLQEKIEKVQHPKWIYAYSLALMNIEEYPKGIANITDHYELLSTDSAWLVKSVILLSDMYYLTGDKKSAIAALEGLLESDLEVPTSLKKQAQERLNNFNL